MADIFISYSRKDKTRAEALARALEGRRWSVWWDPEIRAGDEFRETIEAEIEAARRMIVLWSDHSIKSTFVRDEASRGLRRRILMQVLLDNLANVPLGFGEAHHINLAKWQGASNDPNLQRLLSDIGDTLDRPQPRGLVDKPVANSSKAAKRALLVGISQYEHGVEFPAIATAHESVKVLKEVLTGFDFEVVALPDPGREAMQIALINLFKNANSDDLLLFYFCGHAKLNEDGDLYLCARETAEAVLDATASSLVWLSARTINKTAASHLVILLDCVYTTTENGQFKVDIPAVLQSNLGQGKGKHLVTSSTVIQQDLGSAGERGSVLAKWFAHGLDSWEADTVQDNVITADELCAYVAQKVRSERPQMKPEYWKYNVNSGQSEIARRTTASAPLASALPTGPFFAVVRRLFKEGNIVPFVGDAVYSSGSLSSFSLVSALTQKAGLEAGWKVDERHPLATAAEYLLQCYRGERTVFMDEFATVLKEQSANPVSTTTHDLIMSMAAPWIVVSATYDWVLEQRLEHAGVPFAVVSHILYSADHAYDGMTLVMRYGPNPSMEIMTTDGWTLSDLGDAQNRIIYKIVGSPYINEHAARQWSERNIDTVVVTESDHIAFLARLENEHTKIPDALSRPFQRRSLLFLGYNLDAWHYRLVGHLFSDGGPIRTKRRYAVRQATSPIEERFWMQFVNTQDRLQSDCEAFVQTLRGMPG